MMIKPLTLASLAPIQAPSKRAELNGPTLSGGGGGYWGEGGQGVHRPAILHPRSPRVQVLHTYSNLN